MLKAIRSEETKSSSLRSRQLLDGSHSGVDGNDVKKPGPDFSEDF
jgi:hypothetical protein